MSYYPQKVHVIADSLAFGDGVHTHTFESTTDWFDEIFWARIYAGFHFHHSLQDGASDSSYLSLMSLLGGLAGEQATTVSHHGDGRYRPVAGP